MGSPGTPPLIKGYLRLSRNMEEKVTKPEKSEISKFLGLKEKEPINQIPQIQSITHC